MRRLLLLPLLFALLVLPAAAPAASEPKSETDKTFYALGLAVSQNLAPFGMSAAEFEMVQAGLRDGVLGNPPRVDMSVYGPKIQELQRTRGAVVAGCSAGAMVLGGYQPQMGGRGCERDHLGVSRGVLQHLDLVGTLADDRTVMDDDSSHRDLVAAEGGFGLPQGELHKPGNWLGIILGEAVGLTVVASSSTCRR